jgi:hypothetical protein
LRRRLDVIERNLRVHHPQLRRGEALFEEYDGYDFASLNHAAHTRVIREIATIETRSDECTKFETMVRYRCANWFFLVIESRLAAKCVAPDGWGLLVEDGETLRLATAAQWQPNSASRRAELLHRIATAATRDVNRKLKIRAPEIAALRLALL